MSFFKPSWLVARRTVISLVDEQIKEVQKTLIANQGTADHYQGLANGNLVTLKRLKEMRDAESRGITAKVKVQNQVAKLPAAIKPPKLTSAK